MEANTFLILIVLERNLSSPAVISIGKLVWKNDGPEEVEQILSTMTKYGERNNNI